MDGSADAVQLTVEGHSTQTSDVFVVQNSGAAKLVTVTNGVTTTAPSLRLYEPPSSGTNKVSIKTPGMGSDWTLTLPDNDGNGANYFLKTDGNGVTGWSPISDFLSTASTTTNSSATCTKSCASGALTGGGCQNSSTTPKLVSSYPSSITTWSCTYDGAGGNCTAWVVCMIP